MRWRWRTLGAAAAAAVVAISSACSFGSRSGPELTLYSAQHEDLVSAMVQGFAKETGIDVVIRPGGDFELGNQLVQEGSASPADVFLTENSPAMTLVAGKGLLAPVEAATIAQVPPRFVSSGRDWVGFAARSTVLAYNPRLQPAAGLPKSIMDLAGPGWKGAVGIAAAGADFQAIVSAVLAMKGEAATEAWLKGLKANAKVYRSNVAVMAAVNSGEIRTGIIYHYYWYKDRAEAGANSSNTELKFFGNKDPGAFLSISGAGVVKTSKQRDKAQQLVRYLTSRNGQQILADSTALEYPIASGVAANAKLKPLAELDPPAIDVATLNGPKVIDLMRAVGLL